MSEYKTDAIPRNLLSANVLRRLENLEAVSKLPYEAYWYGANILFRPRFKELKPYRVSYTADGERHSLITYSNDMEKAFTDGKQVALKASPNASRFMIESDQDSCEIRKSWGLK